MGLSDVEEALGVPPRRELERVRVGFERPDPLDVRVEVPRIDEQRTALEALDRDRAHERCGGGRGDHDHLLVGLDVRPDLGDELGVALEQLPFHDRGI